jgi:hypothetical protein
LDARVTRVVCRRRVSLFTHYIFTISHNGEEVVEVNWEHDPELNLDITDTSTAMDVNFVYSAKWVKSQHKTREHSRAHRESPQHLEVARSRTLPSLLCNLRAAHQPAAVPPILVRMAILRSCVWSRSDGFPSSTQSSRCALRLVPLLGYDVRYSHLQLATSLRSPTLHLTVAFCRQVLLLTGFLATILMRVLKNDFTRYARADEELGPAPSS